MVGSDNYQQLILLDDPGIQPHGNVRGLNTKAREALAHVVDKPCRVNIRLGQFLGSCCRGTPEKRTSESCSWARISSGIGRRLLTVRWPCWERARYA